MPGVALLPYRLLSARASVSLIETEFRPGLPGALARMLSDVRPLLVRNDRVAPLSRAARSSGDGSVTQRGWKIATTTMATLGKASADVGHGSEAAVCIQVGRLLGVRGTIVIV